MVNPWHNDPDVSFMIMLSPAESEHSLNSIVDGPDIEFSVNCSVPIFPKKYLLLEWESVTSTFLLTSKVVPTDAIDPFAIEKLYLPIFRSLKR